MGGRLRRFLLSLFILGASVLLLYAMRGPIQRDITGVGEAIDGDSLRLAGEEIRLKGIDAPEFLQTCRISGQETPCGREARAALRRLLAGGLITCVEQGRDRFGRMLAECRLRGADIGAAMVRDGQAIAFGAYEREEAEAKRGYRGVWAGEFERPSDWRARHGRERPGS